MARLWDVKSGELLGSFRGHMCSLKSVTFTPEEKGRFRPGPLYIHLLPSLWLQVVLGAEIVYR